MGLQEVDKLGNDYVPPVSELSALPYLNAVLKETLRLFPPMFAAARVFDEDLSILGHVVPKGTSVYVSMTGMVEAMRSPSHRVHIVASVYRLTLMASPTLLCY